MPLFGTFSDAIWVIGYVSGFSVSAVTLNQYLSLWGPGPNILRIGGIQADAQGAGTGAGNTVLDVLVGGVSVWLHLADKPTLAAASTGGFALKDTYTRAVPAGQRIDIRVIGLPAITGHSLVRCTLALERGR